ncbi:MAG TPA: 4Fe-4S dicluster domain-containing protein [Candidatus Ozemobacteraceae bacterium]|nr:4Fe-4S dicluster domain-containing protein [Candidatus Ozemobacteraceae bacterium]
MPEVVQQIWNRASVKRSPAEWALRWVWDHPEVTVVLSGMTLDEHLEENLRIADQAKPQSLSAEERQVVADAAAAYRRLMQIACTGCQYCMPCPAGVNIPTCFEVYNTHALFQDKQASMMYLVRLAGLLGTPAQASKCTSCGACLKKCPQNLPIPTLLKQVANTFEGPMSSIKLFAFRSFLKLERFWSMFRHRFLHRR